MTLRDQPTLDEFQDEIFRLPLDRRLLIVGPAGTGKTTTLVRRLGQKLDTEHLEGELRIIEKINSASRIGHGANWVMFSPTQLLKQFLKEAFAIERIPAPDLCVRTWGDYRRELGRETLGVLRTVGGGGSFVLKETISTILPNAVTNAGTWFADFDAWQRRRFFEDLSQSAKLLTEHNDGAAASFGHMMATLLAKVGDTSNVSILVSVAEQSEAAQGMLDRLKAETDAEISSKLNLELNRNRSLVDELMDFMDSLRQADSGEDTETDDQELDEDDDDAIPPTRRGSAINAYRRAVRAQARAAATRRALNRKTRTGRIAEWLGERTLPVARRLEVGNSLQLQRLLRRFTNPVSRYVDVVPRRYRAFRRERQHEGRWYVKDGFTSTDLHPLELDLILLSQLQAARSLLERSNVRPESTKWISLKKYADLLRTQVLVDEATDFSPVQLACMFALTNPQLSSFFACGDFNQRLTVWGTRSAEDLQWIFRDLEIRKLRVVYRQSRQLNELAMAIVQAAGGVADDVALPAHVDSEGFPPALLESTEARRLVPWLATRILEIENFVGKLPSIAIFVPSEHDVTPIARELNDALLDHNIQVTPCVEGQIIGDEHNVRVFDAQHIKGLEFEAVFFVGIDRLAETYPELLEKYLYVGATRAATYLGLTCETRPPDIIVSLRHLFTHDWSSV